MAAVKNPRSTASSSSLPTSTPEAKAPTAPASPLPDLLAGLRWGTREIVIAAVLLVAADVFAGWSYLSSYFGFFRVPVDGLGLGLQEIVTQGVHSIFLPLTVVVLVAWAPSRRLAPAAGAVAVYLLFLAVVAIGNHWASAGAVVAQVVGSVVIAAVVFGLRRGFGRKPTERFVIGAVGLLFLMAIPIATGILEAAEIAGQKTTTLRLVTNTPILPNAVPAGGLYSYNNYILIRENATGYWLFRIGDTYAYSIAKSDIAYIRY